MEGEFESGDHYLVEPLGRRTLVAAIDGLGHGHYAAHAARKATAVCEAHAGEPLLSLLDRCHRALVKTRGAAMTVAYLSADGPSVSWAGVGNVEATLVRADPRVRPRTESVMLLGGTIGHRLPRVRETTVSLGLNDTIIFASDGIRDGYIEKLPLAQMPRVIADQILEGFTKGTDDALVLVVRYIGASH